MALASNERGHKIEKTKILVIVPYQGLKELFEELAPSYVDLEMHTYMADMEDAVKIANGLNLEEYNVIISRAGSSKLLQEISPIPVIDVGINTYDMLRAIRIAKNFHGKFFVAGFSSITKYAHIIKDLLQDQIDIITFNTSKEIIYKLEQLKKQAYNLVVGDVITTRIAKEAGFNTVLIISDRENVENALNECVRWTKNFAPKLQKKQTKREKNSRMFHEKFLSLTNINLETFSSNSPNFAKAMDSLRTFAKNKIPVIINGEDGSGKDQYAQALYKMGIYNKSPIVVINGAFFNKSEWNYLIDNESSPLLKSNQTIYFKNLYLLDNKIQLALENFFNDSLLHKRNRVIFSHVMGKSKVYEEGRLYYYILNKMQSLTLYIPKLNERREDIPNLVALYLSQISTSISKQVIGFEKDALQLLIDFNWVYNIDQLRRVIQKLAILSESAFINSLITKRTLDEEEKNLNNVSVSVRCQHEINLNLTLDEIIDQVVNIVLKEENMNQSRAAKRLNISRSTLWRKTK